MGVELSDDCYLILTVLHVGMQSCAAKNSFQATCTVTSGNDGSCTVCANCQTVGGKTIGSCVDTSQGCGDITNLNGKLVCNH